MYLGKQTQSNYFQHEIPKPLLVEPKHRSTDSFADADEHEPNQQLPVKNISKPNDALASNPPASIFRNQPAKAAPSLGWMDDEQPPDIYASVPTSRKTLNLFDETDDEEDMFRPTAPQTTKEKLLTQPINQHIQKEPTANPNRPQISPNIPVLTKPKVVNIFDDSPPNDMFDEIIASKPKTHSVPKTRVSIFDDDNNELFKEDLHSAIAKRVKTLDIPKSSVSVFDDDNNELFKEDLQTAIAKKVNTQDISSTSYSDVTKITSTNNSTTEEYKISNNIKSTKLLETNVVGNKSKPKVSNIFNDSDDDDDDFLATIPTKKKTESPKINKLFSTNAPCELPKRTNIFDDLFGDDEPPEDDFADIFGTKRRSSTYHTVLAHKQIASNVIVPKDFTVDRDPDSDLVSKPILSNFTTASDLESNQSNFTKPMVTNVFDDDVDIAAEPKSIFEPSREDLSKRKQSKGLFGEEQSDEDDSDWFSSISKNKSKDKLVEKDLFESSQSNSFKNSPSVHNASVSLSKESAVISPTFNVSNQNQSLDNVEDNDSTSSVGGQFANFFEKNEDSSDSKMVENRRIFVSYLDNEEPPPAIVTADSQNSIHEQNSKTSLKQLEKCDDSIAESIESTVSEYIQVAEGYKSVISDESKSLSSSDIHQPIEEAKTIVNPCSVPSYVDSPEKILFSSEPISIQEQQLIHDTTPNIATTVLPPIATQTVQSSLTNSATFFDDLPPEDDFATSLFTPKTTPIAAQPIGLFDDLPPDDDFPATTQPTTSTRSTSIFDDLPPDDDEFHFSAPVAKPPSKSSASLFDDLPPDDDVFDQIITSRKTIANPKSLLNSEAKQQNVVRTTEKALFYEDFDDTIIIKPEDSSQHQVSNISNDDEVDKAQNFLDKLTKFTMPSQDLPKPLPERPVVRKLTDNININVAALLPGAKPPSISRPEAISTEESCSELPEKEYEINLSLPPKSTKTESEDSSRLVGLNKGRVKIQVKRRPSTRQARQAEYRKSLLVQDISNPEDIPEEPSKSLEKSIPTNPSKPSVSIVDMLANIPSQPSAVLTKPSEPDDWLISPDTSTTFQKMTPKPKAEPPKTVPISKRTASTSLFSEDDDDDLFASVSKQKLPTVAPNKAPPIVPLPQKSINPATKATPAKSNLFDDDDDSGDDLFGDTSKKIIETQKKITTNVLASKSSLFEDSDDDDLFGSASKHVAHSAGTLIKIKNKYFTSNLYVSIHSHRSHTYSPPIFCVDSRPR